MAASVFVLGRIVITDFQIQKIRNEQVLQLLALGVSLRALEYMQGLQAASLWQPGLITAVLFLLLIGFWMTGKLGAGDVKLLSVIPILVGVKGLLPFAVIFLVLANAISFFMRRPDLVPHLPSRAHLQTLALNNRVPLGVPIGLAGIAALAYSQV
ncbi:prepilin peptidase [Devosia sp. XJ19-1]|uniref:Prepilin peptidase n=1 Tax=Devosia ureilytica TaxID=2952754 RepID=A0A9Q4FSD2_9HYPH|nr:prepilin peptidase [Devosia ureilytica]MCP8883589.1 prepilin peptidase [Devosia ureilytica]MCP8887197.1 prepilin peptidase [Devosia ureilytica]